MKALEFVGLATLIAALLLSCDTSNSSSSSSSDTETDTDTETTDTASVQSGEVPIDLFKGITWSAVQDPDGTTNLFYDGDSSYVVDNAQTAALYYDAYFSETSDIFSDANLVYSSSVAEEDGTGTAGVGEAISYEVPLYTILEKIGQARLTIGSTYYWGLKVIDSLGNTLSSRSYSVQIMPPRDYGDIVLGYDLDGWYLSFAYGGAYDTTIGDLYFTLSSATSSTAIATAINGVEADGYTTFKQYLSAAPTAGATYYAAFVAKDKNAATVSTTGETCRIVAPASVSQTSRWNFMVGYMPLGTTAVDLESVSFNLSWDDLVPPQYENVGQIMQLGTSAASLSDAPYSISENSTTVSGLAYATTYYLQVNVYAYETGSSSVIASWASPVVSFATPSYAGGSVYTMDSGSEIPSSASTYAPAEITTTGAPSTYGNPAPSLALSAGQKITTTSGADMNPYRKATFKFDFKVTSRANTWVLYFDDQNNSSQSFLPASYLQTAPSTTADALQSDLHGVVVALKYYADSPATSTNPDSVFAVYGYQKLIDGAIDIDVVTTGNQTDGSGTPDVKEYQLATIEVYSASDNSLTTSYLGKWITATVAVDVTAGTVTVTLTDGATSIGTGSLDISTFIDDQVEDNSSVPVTGLNRMTLTSLNTFNVDNVSYTINDSTYVRSIR